MWLVNYCSRVPCGARPGMKKSLLLCWFSVLTIEVRTQDQVGEHLQAAVWAHPTPDTVRANRLLALGQRERRSCRPWPLSRKPPACPAGSATPVWRPTRRWVWAFITGSATSTGLSWRIRSRPGSVLAPYPAEATQAGGGAFSGAKMISRPGPPTKAGARSAHLASRSGRWRRAGRRK